MQKKTQSGIQKVSLYIFYGLLGYMPLHIFLSTFLGTTLGFLDTAKILKDVILIFGFVAVIVTSAGQPWFKDWLKNKLVWLIVAYALLTIFLAFIRPTDQDAEILGVVYNLRFLVFFIYAWLLVQLHPSKEVQTTSLAIVTGVGLFVVLFGIVQYVLLPNDFLTHFGYSRQNGVLPAFFIDDKPNLERAMSTLRDPNSLGSYLIIFLTVATAAFITKKAAKSLRLLEMLAIGLCLVFTFSRSAWLGCILAATIFALIYAQHQIKLSSKQIKLLGASLVALLVLGIGVFISARNTYLVQNIVFHADQSTTMEDPNQLRVRFFKESIHKATLMPLGYGPGTAGLASIRNNIQGVQLNEDYYLQILTEVGFAGLALFLAILVSTSWSLYRANRDSVYVWALLASFAGLCLTNFLVHIWSSEAVAYTWWGLAGLFVVSTKTKKPIE